MIKNIFFDLDGTLLEMDLEQFLYTYLKELEVKFNSHQMDGKKISKAIMDATEDMIKNDGTMTNEKRFWISFEKLTNLQEKDIEDILLDFYENDFDKVQISTSKNIYSNKIIKLLKEKGYQLFLTTNPLFPPIATRKRVLWAGCNPDDFNYITTFDNSSFAKPSTNYFLEVINKFSLKKDETMLVGNDAYEDMLIEKIGIDSFIRTDSLINKYQVEFNPKYFGTIEDLYNFCLALPKLN